MLQLTPIGHGFYVVDAQALTIPTVSPSGLQTWTPGKFLAGFTSRGRPLTDGTDSTERNGISLADFRRKSYPEKDGWTVLTMNELSQSVFESAEIEVAAVGDYEPYGNGWSHYAVRSAALVPGSQGRGEFTRSTSPERFAEALSICRFNVRYALQSGTIVFRPIEPLTKSTWQVLGYWSYTGADSTIDEVCRIRSGCANEFIVPVSTVGELDAIGLAALKTPEAYVPGSGLAFESIRIVDPSKASPVWPCAAAFAPDARITGMDSENSLYVYEESIPHLIKLPQAISIEVESGRLTMVDIPRKYFRSNGTGLVFSGKLVAATPKLASELLMPTRVASAQHDLPEEVKRLTLFLNGKAQPGTYVLRTDLEGLLPRKEANAITKRQHAELLAKYGTDLPKDWLDYTQTDFVNLDSYLKRKADGWGPISSFCSMLMLAADNWSVRDWMQKHFPPVNHKGGYPPLYPPVTRQELLHHEKFPELFSAVLQDLAGFASVSMFEDQTRATLLASLLAS